MLWGGGFCVYIMFLPFAMLAAHVAAPWVMFRAVECSVDTVSFVAYAAMGALLWPGARAQSALARTYAISDRQGGDHMPIGDHGSAMPSRGANPGSRSFAMHRQDSGPVQGQIVRGVGGGQLLADRDEDAVDDEEMQGVAAD